MKLKHQWSMPESRIILAMHKNIVRKKFYISGDCLAGIQSYLLHKNMPFCETWDEIVEEISDEKEMLFQHFVFRQSAGAVLLGEPTSRETLQRELNYFYGIDSCLPSLQEPDHLPERLPEPERQAARNGDLAKLSVLYDLSPVKGQKMKNIYHTLLNRKSYGCALRLNEQYGGLENVDNHVLKQHFLQPVNSEEKGHFNSFYCRTIGKNDPEIWWQTIMYGILDQVLLTALDNGIDPELNMAAPPGFQIPLRKLLHFLDEAWPSVEKNYPFYVSHFRTSNHFWDSLFNAAQKFSEWEKQKLS